MCHGVLAQAVAQRKVADDWTTAYARYVGGVPVAAPDRGPVASAALSAGPTVKMRLKAETMRLALALDLRDAMKGRLPAACRRWIGQAQ